MSLEDALTKQKVATEQISEQELKKTLEADGVRFVYPISANVPARFDLHQLEDIHLLTPDAIKNKFKHIIDFLRMPYVTDNFGDDHEARRIWRQDIINKVGDVAIKLLKENRLRSNVVNTIIADIEVLVYLYEKAGMTDDPVGKKLISIYHKIPTEVGNYQELDFMGKMRVNGELSNIALEVLQLFEDTKEKTATQTA